jgi:NAD(P)-dependent dehydrogenase (short-subunit alcohol dehydrogenase family)
MYGRIIDLSIEDMRRQMDVNYWGQVYGSRTAVQHLRRTGGALINVGSAQSDRAIPMQGGYCAAKHALKAFTDALRMELEEQGIPIAVTLVKPASIDTPFFEKARTYLGVEPQPVRRYMRQRW